MELLSLDALPVHLIHPDADVTAIILGWIVLGGVITAVGGLTAARAKGNRILLAVGMALTLAGIVTVGSAVVHHNSLRDQPAQSEFATITD